MTPGGTETVLFISASDDGNACYTGLTLGLDGLLYGTCGNWGEDDSVSGIIFKLDPSSGAFTSSIHGRLLVAKAGRVPAR
jgi:hypothetical protein